MTRTCFTQIGSLIVCPELIIQDRWFGVDLLSSLHPVSTLRNHSNALRNDSSLSLPSQFQEGDRLRASDYITGSVEVRQLRSVYKLSFTDIVRVNRFRPAGMQDIQVPSGEESDSTAARLRRAEKEQNAGVRLYVFLTKKRAKTRMADLEETAFLLRLDVGKEGCICFGKSFGNFDQVCIHPFVFAGLHIGDHPNTPQPPLSFSS